MPQIFMSYRREDSQGYANGLHDRLSEHFGAQSIVRDLDSIPPGADFERFIETAVNSCDVLLALIGPDWLAATDSAGGRRLDRPGDYVQLEIATALARSTPVIPVLLNEAPMPAADQLPSGLVPLATRNALEISDSRWRYDVGRLITALETYLAGSSVRPREAPPAQAMKSTATRRRRAAAGLGVVVALALLAFRVWPSHITGDETTQTSTSTIATSGEGTVTRGAVGSWSGRSGGLTLTVMAIRELDGKQIEVDMAVENSTGDAVHLDLGDFSMVDDTGTSYEGRPLGFSSGRWPADFGPGRTVGSVDIDEPLKPEARRISQLGFADVSGSQIHNIYVQDIPVPPAEQ